MKVIGLTGGVGMGKTVATQFLCEQGVMVVDTDVIAREIVRPGQPALDEVKRRFGADFIGADGQIRRAELGRLVFADADARRDLEGMLHPRIRSVWLAQVEVWRAEGRTLAVVVIPLLFETSAESHFEATVCVACSTKSQVERLTQRGWSAEEIERRIAAQWPTEKKMAAANFVVWTEGEREVHHEQLRRIFRLG